MGKLISDRPLKATVSREKYVITAEKKLCHILLKWFDTELNVFVQPFYLLFMLNNYCVCPLQLPTFSFHKTPCFTFYFWKWITPSLQSAHYYLRIFFDRILIGADDINSSVIAYPTRQFRTRNLRKPCKPVACIRKTRKGKKYFFK